MLCKETSSNGKQDLHEEANNTLKENKYSEVRFLPVVILHLYAIKFIVIWN
jgi:hypothetical protein